MKKFKFLNHIFNNMFGHKFHTEDTYKDSDGKGILQRFIDTCSMYLDEDVQNDIDDVSIIYDPDFTPEEYIHIIWEYLGYIPFAYGLMYQGSKFSSAESLLGLDIDYRKLLKYAISLYKIRCTELFYEILGNFYGIKFMFTQLPTYDIDSDSYDHPESIYDDNTYYNSDKGCLQCIDLEVVIAIPESLYDRIHRENTSNELLSSLILLINKYLPIHINQLSLTKASFLRGL